MGSELVVRAPLEPATMDEAARLAQTAAASGLFAVRRPEEALVILLTGRELGLGAMASLRGIYVVSGRPVLSADLLVACVRRSGLCKSWRVLESTPDRCEITTQRADEEHPSSKVWTSADARRAGLSGRGTWAAYPGQMLRHRCAADLAREVYPEVALGLYDPDEMVGLEPAASRTAETIPAPAETPRTPEAFAEALTRATRLASVPGLWHDAIDGLRAEGQHPEDWTDALAAELDAWLQCRGYRTLSADDKTRLMGGVLPGELLSWHDTLASLAPLAPDGERLTMTAAGRMAAETWLASRWSSLDTEASKHYRLALQRWMAHVLGTPEDVRGAGAMLAGAVAALRSERAAAVDATAAATRAREPGDDDDEPPPAAPPPASLEGRLDAALGATRKGRKTTAAPAAVADEEWQKTPAGMERHAAEDLGHRDAVLNSARKHHSLVGYGPILAARLVALTPPDEHGAMLSLDSAKATVARAQREGRERAARRAA